MDGINTFFHLASALAALLLVYALLKLRRQRDLLRRLVREGAGTSRRVHVAPPHVLIKDLAESLGIPCVDESDGSAPTRIEMASLLDLFLRQDILLIRCLSSKAVSVSGQGKDLGDLRDPKDLTIEIHVREAAVPEPSESPRAPSSKAWTTALGARARIVIVTARAAGQAGVAGGP